MRLPHAVAGDQQAFAMFGTGGVKDLLFWVRLIIGEPIFS
jgi:hypothetical protein